MQKTEELLKTIKVFDSFRHARLSIIGVVTNDRDYISNIYADDGKIIADVRILNGIQYIKTITIDTGFKVAFNIIDKVVKFTDIDNNTKIISLDDYGSFLNYFGKIVKSITYSKS